MFVLLLCLLVPLHAIADRPLDRLLVRVPTLAIVVLAHDERECVGHVDLLVDPRVDIKNGQDEKH